MALVAGVDSSTQGTKIVVRDAATGRLVRQGTEPHPDGTEIDPEVWWQALIRASDGILDGVEAISVAAQQHGLVALDDARTVIRPALLWNDTRSARAADDLVAELGGASAWVEATGVVPVASFTVAKLRWVAQHEPENARRTAQVLLPHDWLTSRLTTAPEPTTDAGDASGTGYFSAATGTYRPDLLRMALGSEPALPRVAVPSETVGAVRAPDFPSIDVVAPGTGDNMGGALGLGVEPGDVVVSIGTSGTAFATASGPAADASGVVASFADATGRFLPLVCTLNAGRVLTAGADALDVDTATFDELALSAPPGAGGLVLLPYLDGERTPNLPNATGVLRGITRATMRPEYVARAFVEGMLCGLADAVAELEAHGVETRRILLIGGGARSAAVRSIAPEVFGRPITVPRPSEYVADGAARQAAWALSGYASPPEWDTLGTAEIYEATPQPVIRERYAATIWS